MYCATAQLERKFVKHSMRPGMGQNFTFHKIGHTSKIPDIIDVRMF